MKSNGILDQPTLWEEVAPRKPVASERTVGAKVASIKPASALV